MGGELVPVSRRLVRASATAPVPDGPCALLFVVTTADGQVMGAAEAEHAPAWEWRGGRLCLAYGPVRVVVQVPGRYAYAVMCAVPAEGMAGPGPLPFAPLFLISLGEPKELPAGADIEILDGVLAIEPVSVAGWAVPLR
jgi:hypothetical protein